MLMSAIENIYMQRSRNHDNVISFFFLLMHSNVDSTLRKDHEIQQYKVVNQYIVSTI